MSANPIQSHMATPVRTYTMLVTPDIAKAWLTEGRFERQRNLRQHHVDELVEVLRRGTFELTALQWRLLPDGRRFLIDGQHRLHAIVKSGIPATFVIIEKVAADETEVASQYGRLDRGSGRTLLDGLKADGELHTLGLAEHTIKSASAAVTMILTGFEPLSRRGIVRKDADIRRVALKEWAAEIIAFTEAVSGSRIGAKVRLTGPMSVGLVTFRYQPELAQPFWRTVAEGVNLQHGQPELVLREYLMMNQSTRRDVATISRVVAGCWNWAFQGKTFVRRPNERADLRPITIDGTPYNGMRVIIPESLYASGEDAAPDSYVGG